MFVVLGAFTIGITLGMLGSGGSAITVPILVYLVGHGAKESIAESMAIVGLISIAAAYPYARAQQIDWRSVLFFGIPGMLGTFAGAWLGGLSSASLQLAVFGVVLFLAAAAMLRKSTLPKTSTPTPEREIQFTSIWKIAMEGTMVGVLTGFVGVGGGFLIVPALVIMAKLPMRLAIGTSLVIIAIKAAVGFAKYEYDLLQHGFSVDFRTIAIFTVFGIAGGVIGRHLNSRLNQQLLQKVFAGFLILVGGFVLCREGSKLFPVNASNVITTQLTIQTDLNQ